MQNRSDGRGDKDSGERASMEIAEESAVDLDLGSTKGNITAERRSPVVRYCTVLPCRWTGLDWTSSAVRTGHGLDYAWAVHCLKGFHPGMAWQGKFSGVVVVNSTSEVVLGLCNDSFFCKQKKESFFGTDRDGGGAGGNSKAGTARTGQQCAWQVL